MSGLSAVMGSSAAFVNMNPDVICSDNDQNNISINVTDGVPSLDMENGDYDVSVYIDASGGLSLNDGLIIEQDGTITAPAWSVDVSGNVSGTFILPDNENLSAPHDEPFNNDFEYVRYIMDHSDISSNVEFPSLFSYWVIKMQQSQGWYNYIAYYIDLNVRSFKNDLLSFNESFRGKNLKCRIVVALTDGTVYYDSDKGANNSYYNATNKGLGNINTRPCVMATQMNAYDYTFETQTSSYNYIYTKEFFVATKIIDSRNSQQQYGGLGNNYGTVMYSFTIDDNGLTIKNTLPNIDPDAEIPIDTIPVAFVNPFKNAVSHTPSKPFTKK